MGSHLDLSHSRNVIVNLKLLSQTLSSLTKFGFLLLYIHVWTNMFVLDTHVCRLGGVQDPFFPSVRSVCWLCRVLAARGQWWMNSTAPLLEAVGPRQCRERGHASLLPLHFPCLHGYLPWPSSSVVPFWELDVEWKGVVGTVVWLKRASFTRCVFCTERAQNQMLSALVRFWNHKGGTEGEFDLDREVLILSFQ